jgi:hypothetical protein
MIFNLVKRKDFTVVGDLLTREEVESLFTLTGSYRR